MVVPYIAAHPLRICLLSQLLSFHAIQALDMEEPFTSIIQTMAKVFYMVYVVIIVAQQTQLDRMVSLVTYM
jgi:hypothetical protein